MPRWTSNITRGGGQLHLHPSRKNYGPQKSSPSDSHDYAVSTYFEVITFTGFIFILLILVSQLFHYNYAAAGFFLI